MKKIFIIAAFALCTASCNNPSSPSGTPTDSTSVNTMDNNGTMNNTDTMNRPTDTTTNMPTDTTNMPPQ
jgi:hypothetical protein